MSSVIQYLCVFSLLLLTTCIDDDISLGLSDPIDGRWNISNVSGGFAGVDVAYDAGSVTWNFDSTTFTLTVTSTLTDPDVPQSMFLPLQSGSYVYSIFELDEARYLSIEGQGIYDNGEYGRIDINSAGDLIIDQSESSSGGADDVYILSFTR